MDADLEEGGITLATEKAPLLSSRTATQMAAHVTKMETCITKYDPIDLTSLKTLLIVRGSIFGQTAMWYVMFFVLAVTGILAVGIVELIERNPNINAQSFSTETISSVIRTVTVAMAFLLGLFVNNAMVRWWDIIKRFEALFGAVKRLTLSLINTDADRETRRTVARVGVLSIEMLRFEKVVEKMPGTAKDNWEDKFESLLAAGNITQEEKDLLDKVPFMQRSFYCWALIGKTVKPLSETKQYRSIYQSVQDGSGALASLKTASNFMFPFLYVHMLAWLVHAVNILTAIGSGITVGIVIARGRQSKAAGHEEPIDASAIFKEFLFLFIQVFLYQAFLAIGCALSYPIVPRGSGAMYRLPLSEMIKAQRAQLELTNKLADEGHL